MKFSYNWLKDYIAGSLPKPEKLAELFTFHSFEVESVEKRGGDYIFDLDILPNRAHDCLSHLGIAKETAVLSNQHFKEPKIVLKFAKEKSSDFVKAQVANKKDCSRYTAQVILDIKVGDSPKWLKDKIIACGLKPINNIVDITNFVMLETGQPLHAFDADKISPKGEFPISPSSRNLRFRYGAGNSQWFGYAHHPEPAEGFPNKKQEINSKFQKAEIIVRRAKKGETIKTLDEAKKEYVLDNNILVITNKQKPIAIAGIKGGLETGIDKNTQNIVIEAANFNPVLIRKASQQLKLTTDASFRFERDIDANIIDFAQKRCAALIIEIAKGSPFGLAQGRACSGFIDFYPIKEKPKIIKLELDFLKNLLGIEISGQEVKQILNKLGFKARQIKNIFSVLIPSIRKDINISEDLVEEIGRIYGYKNIKSRFPVVALKPIKENSDFYWRNKTKDELVKMGFIEVYNYSFCSEKAKNEFDWQEEILAEIENPLSSENKYLRPSLTPHLLVCIEKNFKYFDNFKLFELGNVFSKKGNGFSEKIVLALVGAGKQKDTRQFFELKGVVENLFCKLGIFDYNFTEYEENNVFIFERNVFAEPQRTLIKINGKPAGLIGELKKEPGSFLAILDFDFLQSKATDKKTFIASSAYPPVLRDIALLVPEETKVADVLDVIYKNGLGILRQTDLFEVYQGKGVPIGKKNIAFHLVFQSKQKTLSSSEVDKSFQAIIKAIKNKKWQARI